MNFGMQRFHPSVEHFRKAGVVADFGDGQALRPSTISQFRQWIGWLLPSCCSSRANSTMPVLSETLMRACLMFIGDFQIGIAEDWLCAALAAAFLIRYCYLICTASFYCAACYG